VGRQRGSGVHPQQPVHHVDTVSLSRLLPPAQFDSITCLDNEIGIDWFWGWGFIACDTCTPGPSGSMTNVTLLNNIIRYSDWTTRPANLEGGFKPRIFTTQCSEITLLRSERQARCGFARALREIFRPRGPQRTCDSDGPLIPPVSGPPIPLAWIPCRLVIARAWFNNRDHVGKNAKCALLELEF